MLLQKKNKYKFYNPLPMGIFDLLKYFLSVQVLPTIHQLFVATTPYERLTYCL